VDIMHIKRMHEMIEKLTKCAEMELEKGIDKIDAEEMGEVTDMIKDLAEAEYYSKISKAMDEAEYGEDYDYMGAYDEYERKGYRGQRRDSRGRYMSRRGYVHYMMPEMDWDDMEYQRDMDRPYGRMGYGGSGSSSGMSGGSSSSGSRGYSDGGRGNSESRYDRARRGYEETKATHKDNSSESKQMKMKSLEDYMKSLAEDVTEMVNDMSQEEKSLMKQKMQVLMQKIQ
jgi:hypothetical protein